MSFALDVYHKLPASSRSVVASARGYYLRWWRYDKETDRLVEQALERDTWSKQQWADWQSERLSYILHRAATQVPHYRHIWEERRRQGEKTSWEYLENWPILEKKTLRANSIDFVADDCSTSKMFHDHTSGTTGTSLDLWFSAQAVKEWYALLEARAKKWYGISRKDRWAILGGQLVTPVKQQKPPFWVWNAGLNQLYLSSYHLAPNLIPSYLDAIAKYRIKYVLGYPSAIYALAQEILKLGRKDLAMDVVITNAEPLYDYQRLAISEAFSCPVRETYGMSETVAAASECEHGSMHQWPDTGIIEIDDEGTSSDFICTGLINADMPLIRYRVGDSGKLSEEICSCGKRLPLMEKVEGRSDDLLYTADGRRVGRLDPIFKNKLPIIEAQIIQKSLKQLNVKYVPAHNFTKDTLKTLSEQICERMGDIEVMFEEVLMVPRTNRGKFRAVICELSPNERAALDLV
ncbi:MAG: phenylacetate--CoA ligase family protein [Pyrinomonadaceae bacterium]